MSRRREIDDGEFGSDLLGALRAHGSLVGFRRRESDTSPKGPRRLPGRDYRGADLTSADLSGVWLRDYDFRRSTFRLATLDGAWLTAVDLRGADLRGASLKEASICACDLRGTDLRGAFLRNARFAHRHGHTGLEGTDMEGADLREVDLRGATYCAETRWPIGFDPEAAGASNA